jgi:hypothetical protein
MPFALLILIVAVYGVFRAQRSAESLDLAFSVNLGTVIIAWLSLSQVLLRFIDRHNRSKKIYGFGGFLALLGAIGAIEWLVFRLKVQFGLASDASNSLLSDIGWLALFPVVAYYASSKKRANQSLQPTAPLGRG